MSSRNPQMNTYTVTLINFNGRRVCRRVRSWNQTDAKETAAQMAQHQNWVRGWAVTGYEVSLQPSAESGA